MSKDQTAPRAVRMSIRLLKELDATAEALDIPLNRLIVESIKIGFDQIKHLQAEGNPPAFPAIYGGRSGHHKNRQPKVTAA